MPVSSRPVHSALPSRPAHRWFRWPLPVHVLFENNGNLCHPGSVHIKVLPPIRTAGMSKAEQKQLPDAVRQAILAQL